MRNSLLFLLLFFLYVFTLSGQVVVADRTFPRQSDELVITFYADRGDRGLKGFTGDVYAHTGVITTESKNGSDWKHVKTSWGQNTSATKLNRVDDDVYQLVISPDVNRYYGTDPGEIVLQLAFVFRSADGSRAGRNADGGDIFLDLYGEGLYVRIIQPDQSPLIIMTGETFPIEAAVSEKCDIYLYVGDSEISYSPEGELSLEFAASISGRHWLWVKADNGTSIAYDSVYYFARGEVPVANRPTGTIPGVNYIDDNTAVVVLHDPPALKEYVFLKGDFNDWLLEEEHYMNRSADGTHYWVTLENLEAGNEYAYQFLVDGTLRIADPFTHKVLDPWHDRYISDLTYPGLKSYPEGKTTGIVSILQTAREEYEWQVTDFVPPEVGDLVIYEMLIRDFVATGDIITITDTLDYLERLGINAIELMPVNEFEGNDSWGYNPSFYFAFDKAYGRMNDLRRFIDECHKRGIAVILDMVLNHSYGQSPLVQMYFDATAGSWGQPSADNPWYNEVCPHPPFCWGYDFDHESPFTQEFIDRVNRYWLEEFRIDGFRFDFTKGFTNSQTANQGSAYDSRRISLLKRMADRIWEVNERAFVILEHFADNREEKELAAYGMLLWGNMNYNYNEGTMGYISGSDLSRGSWKSREWDAPHLIAYMESHDEERLMYKNLRWGNSHGNYDTRQKGTALRRMELAATFYFTIPGPKMIWQFGELGYDYSINYCPDGSIQEGCRTSAKPVRWDYYNHWQRKRLFDIYSALISLKKSQPVFATNDFTTSLSGELKRVRLDHPENSVIVLGNFGVTTGDIIPGFHSTGTWYEFFSREAIEVKDVNSALMLMPGEYRLYSNVEFPGHGLPLYTPCPEPEVADMRVIPNPSAGRFRLGFELLEKQDVNICLYNSGGQKVLTLLSQSLDPGFHEIPFDISMNRGGVPPGIYIIGLNMAGTQFSKRLFIK